MLTVSLQRFTLAGSETSGKVLRNREDARSTPPNTQLTTSDISPHPPFVVSVIWKMKVLLTPPVLVDFCLLHEMANAQINSKHHRCKFKKMTRSASGSQLTLSGNVSRRGQQQKEVFIQETDFSVIYGSLSMESTLEQHLDDTMKNPAVVGVLCTDQQGHSLGCKSRGSLSDEHGGVVSVLAQQAAALPKDPTDSPTVCLESDS
ncbi:hypothetical protein CCH79_00010706, partial [Gambusia affinis]